MLYGVAKTRFRKLVYVGVSTVLVLTIIGTQSRGGTLALAGSVLFMWWLSQRRFAGLVAMGVTLLIVISFAPPQYFERMETISSYEQESSAMGRIQAWKAATRMAAKHPVTGVGAGHFPLAVERESDMRWITAHSSYFLVLGELGIPGIVFIMSLLVGNFVRLRRLRLRTQGGSNDEDMLFHDIFMKLSVSLVAFGIGGAFLSATYYPHIFVISGLVTAATFIYERTIESSVRQETLSETEANNTRV